MKIGVTQKEAIVYRLQHSPVALACHEFKIIGVSENSIATRLSELARDGKVFGFRRPGKPFKEWSIKVEGTFPGF